ncbi:MAG: hypothetical protein L7F78_11515, partial [Syntrophales bacterium LBB04]|nr:hypothetical protein [Syntrophales bacterium LBB04]
TISFMIYHDLVKLKDGEPWPRDPRYLVRLEPNLMTGMLKRVVLENKEAFELSKERLSYAGPVKISEIWDRKYFNVVVSGIEQEVAKTCYVRDSFFRRTDNLILWKEGRENIDFFIGMSELVVSVMEDTFLQRLADPTYGVPVVKSKFTSYPPVVPSAKWFEPDPDCAFVPKMKGLVRQFVQNRKGEKLVSSEAVVIRASYVDYRKRQIIIPPGGLYYSSRNGRNVRPLAGEAFYILGKKAYLLSTESYLVVRKNFRIDLWKEQPMGDGNLLFWQDVPLGDGSKALRYIGSTLLWGRPVAILRVVKYSGNAWGANMIVAPGLNGYSGYQQPSSGAEQYSLPEIFAEGGTYLIPKWVSPDFVEVAEMATPGMDSFTISYEEPQPVILKAGEETSAGKYRLKALRVDPASKSATLALLDSRGKVLAEKSLGPLTRELLDTLPQYNQSQQRVILQYEDVHVELDLSSDFSGGKVPLYVATGIQKLQRDRPWAGDPRFVIRPEVLMRDPFLILGEESYLLSLKTASVTKKGVVVKRGEKELIDPSGYRIWYEYGTDHYGKPYGEFPLVPPSGGWQIELPVSTSFPSPLKAQELKVKSGINPQQKEFFLTDSVLYGATRFVAKKITDQEAHFSRIEYPVITEALFSLDRPYVVQVRQESYRWWWNKRIYAFRKENGILVEVRDWTGGKVLASKLLVPATQQQYKIEDQEKMSLTLFDLDMHIELVVDPSWYKGSDYAPWANDVPYGWADGTISFMIYHDLVKLKDGEP